MSNPTTTAHIRKANQLIGKSVVLRNAIPTDAEFILGLRTDSKKALHLSPTTPLLSKQVEWLQHYERSEDQAYFIVEDLAGNPWGTARIYDQQAESFCFGSWILKNAAPKYAAVESLLLCYAYAVDHLGFTHSHFQVRKANESVWRFKERFGATRIGETALDYFYEMQLADIMLGRNRYQKFLSQYQVVKGT